MGITDFSAERHFLDLLRLTPANPNRPMPINSRLVGSGMGTVPSSANAEVNGVNPEASTVNETKKTKSAIIYVYNFKINL